MSATPACAGEWRLFDSTFPIDHHEARELCAVCPAIEWCRSQMGDERNLTGTWAGVLYGASPKWLRLAAEENMFTDAEARAAHARWFLGQRDDYRTKLGERTYQRRAARRKRREVA